MLNIKQMEKLTGIKPSWLNRGYSQTYGVDYEEVFAPVPH
jgi:hypothetical protein